jgi:hypothetical protein
LTLVKKAAAPGRNTPLIGTQLMRGICKLMHS